MFQITYIPIKRARMDPELERLREDRKEVRLIVQKQEGRVQGLETKVLTLINIYIVFQGVIITVISQASTLNCNSWWVPFSLSLFAFLIDAIAFAHTIIQYHRTSKDLEVQRTRVEDLSRRIVQRENGNQNQGQPDQPIHENNDPVNRNQLEARLDNTQFLWRKIFLFLTAVLLLAFSVVVLVSCPVILCINASKT